MPSAVPGIDHAVILVHDLDAARSQLTRLGFHVTPRGQHPGLGTHNHCVMLQGDYFEALAVHTPQPSNQRWTDILAKRPGLAALALQTTDSRADEARLISAGVPMSATVDYGRPVDADGVVGVARFSSAHADPAATPGLRIFLCQHHTRDLVWAPVWQTHPNGAQRLLEVAGIAADPAARAEYYRRLAGRDAVRLHGETVTVDLGATPLRFLTPAAFALHYGCDADGLGPPPLAAMVLAVRDLAVTRRVLDAAGVPTYTHGGRIYVRPEAVCGTLIGFAGL
jgi:hypothetical protein